jgi:uncharacterized protein YndB with AHSA1/START domain
MTSGARPIRRRRLLAATYPHSSGLVWRALADDELLAEWLEDADVQPRVGHRFAIGRPPLTCEVTAVDRPRRLEVECVAGRAAGTRLEWTLDPVVGGTRLALTEHGPAGAGATALGAALALAWRVRLRRRLERCLAGHAGEPLASALI